MAVLPRDYDPSDGVQDGLDACPHCDRTLAGEGGYHGAVYRQDGTRYEHILDTDASNRPFFCKGCWAVLEANRRAEENHSLTNYD